MPEQCPEISSDSDGLHEVEVDQRALMNILSRYPGTFDVLRELIQNADDADAHKFEVHFRSEEAGASNSFDPNKLNELNVCKWIIKNDGNKFTKQDWKRLGRIADGNDNSIKVGAFGVGFYSVLSKSDRPLVTSNGKSLQFFRGQDGKLRKKSIVSHPPDSWTTVELELRVPERLPVLADLARFLVSSVAFLANIESISVYMEGHDDSLLCIQKESGKSMDDISLPPHLARTTESQTLTIESITRTVQTITINAKDWVFTSSLTSPSSLVDTSDTVPERPGPSAVGGDRPTSPSPSPESDPTLEDNDNVITHDLYTATVRVDLHSDSEMRKGVESTIKPLPSSFECKALYFNSEQHESLTSSHLPRAKHLAPVISGPQGIFSETNSGRLFIGQSTNQTTGIGLHLSGHFLSTMERGSIDLANGQVAAWNREVLWVGGLLARIIYEEEMRSAKSKDNLATQVGLYTMNRFAFGPASPHSGVSQILEDAFFSCCHHPKSPFPVVSDAGISCLSNSQFRKSNKDLSFIKKCRVIHEKVEPRQLSEIIKRYNIPMFQYGDIVQEFEAGVPPETLRMFFEWWEGASKITPPTESAKFAREKFCKALPSRGVLRGPQVEIALRNIKYFTFLPLPDDLSPPDTICIEVRLGFPTKANVECFGWSQLPLLHWLRYACTRARRLPEQERTKKDMDAGYRVLRVLVQFALVENLSKEHWEQVAELMQSLECIPTTVGRNLPKNSYFEQANIIGDLPVVDETAFLDIPTTLVAAEKGFEHKVVGSEHVRRVLRNIGVRTTMGWEDLIGRLEGAASVQSNDRFLQYLAYSPPWGRLPELKGRKVFCSEAHGRLCPAQLYFPSEDVRRLGLPILALPPNNATIGLLYELSGPSAIRPVIEYLGIQTYPSLRNIILLAASKDMEVRRFALQHFLLNLETRYDAYKPDNFADVAFIPTKCGLLARPNEVLGSAVWEKLGFKQISPELRRELSRLGIKEDPSVETIIEYLKTPSRTLPDITTASVWFENLYLYGKLPTPKLRDQLSTIPFVPVKKLNPLSSSTSLEYISPKECFTGQAATMEHRDIFPFVDFGENGNNFLDSCCAKKSPDASDIARKIMQDPDRYLAALGDSTELYLKDLRSIASQLDSISEDDKRDMKKASMFLASRKNKDVTKLLRADQVVIVDWGNREFENHVFVPPKGDDLLEKMYCAMGSAFLGTFVRHDITPTGHKADRDPPFTPERVVSRIRCFMYQRDANRKAGVSFYDPESADKLRVGVCKALTLKKVFAPPHGILPLAETGSVIEIDPVQKKAGLEFSESDDSCTLWMVKDSIESENLHNDIAVALCHVLLKTYGPNDVLLLASLFAKNDEGIEVYYGSEMKCEFACPPNKKAKSKKGVKFEVALAPFLAKAVGLVGMASKPGFFRVVSESTEPLEKAMATAFKSWGEDVDGPSPDFSLPSRPRPSVKRHNGHCKQAHSIRLKENESLRDATTGIRFFIARDAQCQCPSIPVLEEFATLISTLARVFDQDASRTCYIFWKDTDEDLMAFNRDQKYIFLNLAHYSRFSRDDSDKKKMITEWYLIMAHEIAHNVTLDHDEYHGSLSSKIAVTYILNLHQRFSSVFAENIQQPSC